jgi:hypothetical protein
MQVGWIRRIGIGASTIVIDAKKGDWSGIAPERCATCHIARIARAMSAADAEPIHSLASHGRAGLETMEA